LSFFFGIVWLVFFKFRWLPWNKLWKSVVGILTITIALVVIGALQYYTPASSKAVVESRAQFIYPQVNGPVEEVFIQGSQPVKAGDKLFSIDPRPFQYAVDNWTAAEKLAHLALDDAERLVKGGAIARFALDQRRAEHDQAKAQLNSALYNLENTVITAPADGLITLNTLRPGQQLSSANPALSFIDSSKISIVAAMKQNGLKGIVPGKKVSISFIAAPGEIYSSEVLRTVGGVIQGQVTIEGASSPLQAIKNAPNAYPIMIAFPKDAPEELRQAGKLASVTVFTDEGNPINILAIVLLWISTWMDFIF
jgi:multidrug resistance efflux pump